MTKRGGFLFEAPWVLRGALVVVAVFCFCRSVGYSTLYRPEQIPSGVALVTAFVPLWVWSLLWLLAALMAVAAVPKAWPGGSIGCAALSFVWATGYAVSWSMSIEGVTVIYPHGIPLPAFVTNGSPAERDYLSSSVYWTVLLLLGAGYILARKAIDASRVLHTLDESS
jgi:hypothetical protein